MTTRSDQQQRASVAAVEALGLSRSFGSKEVIKTLDLRVGGGEIHALLGPNGAGKTTLLRIFGGLMTPTGGTVRTLDGDPASPEVRRRIGWIPSADRSFYLRISGLENLIFFGRLHGLSKREAATRGVDLLRRVGLGEATRLRTGLYSHGMLKRLGVARGLIADPEVLMVDEATHDLDPEGTDTVRKLIRRAAVEEGVGVVWATQRLDEIRDFADSVTVLGLGRVRFSGSVDGLLAAVKRRSYMIEIGRFPATTNGLSALNRTVGNAGVITEIPGRAGAYSLTLASKSVLGEALAALTAADYQIVSCREQRSLIEQAFIELTEDDVLR